MKRIANKGRRRLGIPGRPALILGPGESQPIDDDRLEEFRKNKTVARWLEAGVLEVSDEDPPSDDEAPPADDKPQVKPPIGGAGIKQPVKPKPQLGGKQTDDRPEPTLPEGVTGEGVELHHAGGGWYDVYVNGFKVTDSKVRKDEAESLTTEYK